MPTTTHSAPAQAIPPAIPVPVAASRPPAADAGGVMITSGLEAATGPLDDEATAAGEGGDTRAVGPAPGDGAGGENGKRLARDSELSADVTLGPCDVPARDEDRSDGLTALGDGDDHTPADGDALVPADPVRPGVPPDGEPEGVTLAAGDSLAGLGEEGDGPDDPGDAGGDWEGGISEGEAQSTGAPQYRDTHSVGGDVYRSCAPAKRRNTAIDCQLSSTLTRKTTGPSSTYRLEPSK